MLEFMKGSLPAWHHGMCIRHYGRCTAGSGRWYFVAHRLRKSVMSLRQHVREGDNEVETPYI